MCHPILIGALAGLVVAKLAFRWRARRWGYGGGGGCGGGWGGGWGRRHGRHGGFGYGPRQAFHLMNELELNQRQREEVKEVFSKIKESFIASRGGRVANIEAILGSVAGENFDRAKAESAIAGEGEKLAALRKEIIDGFEHVHNILTPEQREKLRSVLSRGFGFGGGDRGGFDEANL